MEPRNLESAEEPGEDPGLDPPMQRTISLLVVEDNRLLREGIVAVLQQQADLVVVAVAEDSDGALLRVQETSPRVVLVDAGLGNHDSHRLVEQIREAAARTRVVVMDLLPVPEEVVEFVMRGASGFVVKDATVDEFLQTIRSVAAGKDVLPATLTGTLFTHIARNAVDRGSPDVMMDVRLTQREREVIDLIAEGLSNKEMAQRLNLSPYTIKSHVHNILEKLALHSRLQVAAHAHQSGRQAESA